MIPSLTSHGKPLSSPTQTHGQAPQGPFPRNPAATYTPSRSPSRHRPVHHPQRGHRPRSPPGPLASRSSRCASAEPAAKQGETREQLQPEQIKTGACTDTPDSPHGMMHGLNGPGKSKTKGAGAQAALPPAEPPRIVGGFPQNNSLLQIFQTS